MKISRLQITNFIQVKSLDMKDLTGTTILTGENGVGKTTILNAIGFAFGFDVRDARGVGIKLDELVGPNGDSAVIKLLMEVGGRNLKLTSTIAKGRYVEIEDVERKQPAFLGAKGIGATYEALYALMEADPKHIECALSPRAYLLGPDLGNILAALCSGDWSMKDVELAAGEHWAYLGPQLFHNPPCTNLPLVGKNAFELRAEVKKSLAKVKAEIERLGDTEQPTSRDGKPMGAEDIPKIQDALSGLQAQRDALLAEKARIESGATDRRPELEAAKAAINLDAAQFDVTKADGAYAQTQATFESANKALAHVKEAHAAANAACFQAEKKHEQRLESGNVCECCGHAMTEDEKASSIQDAAHELYKAKQALEEINLNDAKAQFDGFEQANTEARIAKQKAQAEYDRLVAEANRIDYELEKLGPVKESRSIDAVQTELESTEERIEVGTKKLNDLIAWSSKDEYAAEVEQLAKTIEHLDWAVAAFKDGEFLKSRLSGSAHVFEDACNEKLAPFGYSLSVVTKGKECSVWLRKGEREPAPITRCSKAELVLAGYAVATAFGTKSPVCIDDMDAMYSETKSKFIGQLKMRTNEAPLFAAGAWTAGTVDLEPITKYLTNAKVVWVEKGDV